MRCDANTYNLKAFLAALRSLVFDNFIMSMQLKMPCRCWYRNASIWHLEGCRTCWTFCPCEYYEDTDQRAVYAS